MAQTISSVRQVRVARGIAQSDLARRAGISRQALSAIESGVYQPGVAVALAIARELNESVEALFGGPSHPAHVEAAWMGEGRQPGGAARGPVALGRVGGRLVAVPQAPVTLRLAPPAGMLEAAEGGRARVATFRTPAEIDSTLLTAGCDPAITIFADWLGRRHPAITVAPLARPSRAALTALIERRVHAAGVHLCDRKGDYNLEAVRGALKRRPALMVNFARWEMGLGVRRGNPPAIRAIPDVARPKVRIANRELGSGARLVLDQALADAKIDSSRIAGYGREFHGHLEVAGAIAAGDADTGMTLRVAAEVWGLDFVPVREERYDLVILRSEMDCTPVRVMLDALNSSGLAREVADLCGYDTARMGQVIARLNS